MIKAEKILENFTNADSAADSATNAENFGGVTEKNSADVPTVENVKNEDTEKKSAVQAVSIQSADDVSIYTATAKEIHYWHACVNIHVGTLLANYDLNVGTKAFDAFKIGVDAENHAATFALDETHYLKFDLNDTNVRPIDNKQAEKVLRKVNAMRLDRIKRYEQFEKYVTVQVLL